MAKRRRMSNPVFFNHFAAAEPSATVCIVHGTLCNHPSFYFATTANSCGCEFRPREFRSVSAEPLAATRGTLTEKHYSNLSCNILSVQEMQLETAFSNQARLLRTQTEQGLQKSNWCNERVKERKNCVFTKKRDNNKLTKESNKSSLLFGQF